MKIKTFCPEKKIEELKVLFNLDSFTLSNWEIQQSISPVGKTTYVLEMEYFPPGAKLHREDDYNPSGTVIIGWEIELNRLVTFIMVEGKDKRTRLNNDVIAHSERQNTAINWINKWLQISEDNYSLFSKEENERESEFHFRSVLHGTPIFPGGLINIRVNEFGEVTFYTVHGVFPTLYGLKVSKELIAFLGDMEETAKRQLRKFCFPDYDTTLNEITYKYGYGIEEVLLQSNGEIGADYDVNDKSGYVSELSLPIIWYDSDQIEAAVIHKRYLDEWLNEFREKTTFKYEGPSTEIHPDLEPIEDSLVEKIVSMVTGYVKNEIKALSGEYQINRLVRENGLIQAYLGPVNSEMYEMKKKMLCIDPVKLEIVQIFDKPVPQTALASVNITFEEAWAKIAGSIILKPYFVLDKKQRQLSPMYLLDSNVIIDAYTGEILD